MQAIRQATAMTCVELQEEAAFAYAEQAMYVRLNLLGRAAQEQRHAAQAHMEMVLRLERLIGVA